jgi:uncharacterized protein
VDNFTPLSSLLGGALIGLSGALLLVACGRIAGISGIVGGLLSPQRRETGWRAAFVLGLVAGGALLFALRPAWFAMTSGRSVAAVAAAGLIVGFGTRLSGGCTSGHGVCGLSRLSARSMVATASFMVAGLATVYVVDHLIGGL